MRRVAEFEDIERFIKALSRTAIVPTQLFFTGGASAVLIGWRASTIDVDIHLVPDSDPLLRALTELKESLEMNIELACPAHFIPELPGWRERSVFITQEGKIAYYHYDFYAQALAKIERGHRIDHGDVEAMFRRGLVDGTKLMSLFESIVPQLYRYPALDRAAFRRAVNKALDEFAKR